VIEPTDGQESHSAAFGTGIAPVERDLDTLIVSMMTAATATPLRATNQSRLAVSNLLLGFGAAFWDFCSFFIALQ